MDTLLETRLLRYTIIVSHHHTPTLRYNGSALGAPYHDQHEIHYHFNEIPTRSPQKRSEFFWVQMVVKVYIHHKISTVGKIYTPNIFVFFKKESSISRFLSLHQSQMKALVILHTIGVFSNFKIHLFLKNNGFLNFYSVLSNIVAVIT